MTTATSAPVMQPDQMAQPPEEITGVILALRSDDSSTMLEWVVQSMYDLEQRMDALGADASEAMQQDHLTLSLAAQACSSAAATSAIYKDPYHHIFLLKEDAIHMVEMLSLFQSEDSLHNLYRQVIRQVDLAFIRKNEFANVPAD